MMSVPDKKQHEKYLAPIVLATGGTGGHIFPAQALAEELSLRGYRLILITDKRGNHYQGLLGELETFTIGASPLAGSFKDRLIALLKLFAGLFQAIKILRRLRPSMVVGFGGYPSFPTMYAAGLLGIPTALHEQNAVLGRANRLLVSRAKRIALSFDKTNFLGEQDMVRSIRTGNPVRPEIAALAKTTYTAPTRQGPIRLFISGGSQGAKILGEVVPKAIILLPESMRKRFRICQQVRAEQLEEVQNIYREKGISADISIFFNNIHEKLKNTHLVIGRAGASTIAELTTIGIPAILVPYHFAVDNHQMINAARLCDAGGGWIIPEENLDSETLMKRLGELFCNPHILVSAAEASARTGLPDATEKLVNVILDMLHEHKETET